jgi:PQQ-like domain
MKLPKYVKDLLVVSSGTTATEGEVATKTGPSVFVPSAVGCGMAHCDSQMSDNSHMIPPKGDLELAWSDLDAAGDAWGLGCASNAKVTACALGPLPGNSPYLRVYNPYGDMIWSYPLNVWTWTSSPLINDEGQVIASDNERLIFFDSDGSIIWERELGGGLVISPVVTENGLLVFGTLDGVVMTLDPSDGSKLAEIRLTDMIDGLPGTFGSRNTPCVMGNRIYLSTEFKPLDSLVGDETRTGRLYAIEVRRPSDDVDATEDLIEVAWHAPYGSRSGSSPTCRK